MGQTASGKSDLGIDLAVRMGGPSSTAVVSMDAMQLYRGLDIGTAKTPIPERRGIPHSQIDELAVSEEASVARYQQEARRDVHAAEKANRQVVAVGGSGLYVRALLDMLVFPGTDKTIRQRLESELEIVGPVVLHTRLQKLDPDSAERIHPHNGRRLVRALEVIEVTGQPFTAFLPKPDYFFPNTVQLAIAWENQKLDERIDDRTKQMFRNGILEETETLLSSGQKFGKTASRATGYAEAIAVCRGEMTVDEAVEQVALATRQLARRQQKWFRRDHRIIWLNPDSSQSLTDQAFQGIDAQSPN